MLQRSCITIRDARDEDNELFIGRVNSNETDLNGIGKDGWTADMKIEDKEIKSHTVSL